jgi:hypothetical protein
LPFVGLAGETAAQEASPGPANFAPEVVVLETNDILCAKRADLGAILPVFAEAASTICDSFWAIVRGAVTMAVNHYAGPAAVIGPVPSEEQRLFLGT